MAAPSNNNFAQAITGLPISGTLDLTEATLQSGEPNAGGLIGGNTAWYRHTLQQWQTPESTFLSIRFDDPNAVIAVYRGTTLGGLTLVATAEGTATDDMASLLTPLVAGSLTYYVQIGVKPGSSASGPRNVYLNEWYSNPPLNEDRPDWALGYQGTILGEYIGTFGWLLTTDPDEPLEYTDPETGATGTMKCTYWGGLYGFATGGYHWRIPKPLVVNAYRGPQSLTSFADLTPLPYEVWPDGPDHYGLNNLPAVPEDEGLYLQIGVPSTTSSKLAGQPVEGSDVPYGVAPDPGTDPEPEPGAGLQVVWSYAQRPAAQMFTRLDFDEVDTTPTMLPVSISAAYPRDTITLSAIGPTLAEDFQQARADAFGDLDLSADLPALETGDYVLRVESGHSGTTELAFSVLDEPLRNDDISTADPPPPALAVQRWTFVDVRDSETRWTMQRNPAAWSNLNPPNDFTHQPTTAPDGQILTWEAGSRPWRIEFTGYLDDQEEYERLEFWSEQRRRLWLIDHRNRTWLLTIESFDARARVQPNVPWSHDYTVRALVFKRAD